MTTAVNMKQAVAGATVHFRCGGSAVVYSAEPSENMGEHNTWLNFIEYHRCGMSYNDNGSVVTKSNSFDTPFDIIRIEPPQFKWEDVQRGMAFMDSEKELCFYIGKSVNVPDNIVVEYAGSTKSGYAMTLDANGQLFEGFTRAPEHDKVQA